MKAVKKRKKGRNAVSADELAPTPNASSGVTSGGPPDLVYEDFPLRSQVGRLRITVTPPDEDRKRPTVVIDGTRPTLLYLAEVIRTQAEFKRDCGYELGSGFLGKKSCFLYVHRVNAKGKCDRVQEPHYEVYKSISDLAKGVRNRSVTSAGKRINEFKKGGKKAR